MADAELQFSIGAVERDSGIARDTLRVWERRYGVPVPQRNNKGERVYSESQLRHLQRVKRLMGQGYRPGQLLTMSMGDLLSLEHELDSVAGDALPEHIAELIGSIQVIDAAHFETVLQQQYDELGMKGFIIETVVPLLRAVGESWAAGKLQIFQEHFVTTQLIRFINVEITRLQPRCKKPLVMLATLPGEQHTLGLLMVSAMLSAHEISTLNLGGEVPIDQIVAASSQFDVDVVGITFSGAYHYTSIRKHITELRETLPAGVELWAGGEGVRRLRKIPEGVSKFSTLESLPI